MEEQNKQKKLGSIMPEGDYLKCLKNPKDFTILYIVNAAYTLKNKQEELKKILMGIDFDGNSSINLFDIFIKNRALSGLTIGGLGKIASLYLRLLERMGAKTKEIIYNKNLEVPQLEAPLDITFSIGHFDSCEIKKIDVLNPKVRAFQDYALMSNTTKMNGFSINSNGDYITTLYNLFFQLIGFKIEEYFRSESSEKGFTLVFQKMNNLAVKPEDFDYIFFELKKRNPTRYF